MTKAHDQYPEGQRTHDAAPPVGDSRLERAESYPLYIFDKYIDPSEDFMHLGETLAANASARWAEPDDALEDGPEIIESPYYELLTAIDSANYRYWIRKFNSFTEDRFNRSWNWPSFFFGSLRYCVKGMSLKAIFYLLLFTVISLILEVALGAGEGVLTLISFALSAFIAVMGSNDYFKFCNQYKDDIQGGIKAKKKGMILLVIIILIQILLSLTENGWS